MKLTVSTVAAHAGAKAVSTISSRLSLRGRRDARRPQSESFSAWPGHHRFSPIRYGRGSPLRNRSCHTTRMSTCSFPFTTKSSYVGIVRPCERTFAMRRRPFDHSGLPNDAPPCSSRSAWVWPDVVASIAARLFGRSQLTCPRPLTAKVFFQQ